MAKPAPRMTVAARVLVAVACVSTVGISQVVAQDPDFEPPRLSNGSPDFNGIWKALNAAHYDVEPHIARSAMQVREGPHGPLPDVPVLRLGAAGAVPGSMGVIKGGGRIPYTPEARALKEENQANWVERDPEVKCYMPGVPRATYMPFPFQIFQNESSVFMAYEFAGAVRDIYLHDVGPAETDSWMGQSVGRWEGDTFVVEVTGQSGPNMVRSVRESSHQPAPGRRALYDDEPEPSPVRSDDGGPGCLHRAVDHYHAAVPSRPRTAPG